MTEIDNRIRDLLDADDKEFLGELEADRGMWRQVGDSLTGPMGGWAKLIFGLAIVFGLLLVFCFYKIFTVHEPFEHSMWAISALAVLVVQGFIKEWFWARMNMLTVLREVKRLQVQVALLREGK